MALGQFPEQNEKRSLTLDKIGWMGYIKGIMETVQIFNVTKGVVIAQQARVGTSLGQRLKGLLGKANLLPDGALILNPCSSIHTFFMRFTIDVLFLDKQMRIIKIIQNMPAYRFSPIVWGSQMTIELPAGKIAQSSTQIGDLLEFK